MALSVHQWKKYSGLLPGIAPPIRVAMVDNSSGTDTARRRQLKRLTGRCQQMTALMRQVQTFAKILTWRHGHDLPDWIEATRPLGLPGFDQFLDGLIKDQAAVTAGLTLPYSNGPTEGANTKIKLLKRQMFGRAGLRLLRHRILRN
ncbi:transposase [Actinocatenispora sera]|nr:transposase [Actinocatenispora sera]